MSRSGAGVRIHSTTSRVLVSLVFIPFPAFLLFSASYPFRSFYFFRFPSHPLLALLSFLHGCIRCPMGPTPLCG
ncbi:hypothetical protein B9Z19DRAFT_1086546 [Tuber borchii]|uniref:Uncharacterized protein n=1 Tax=Tuber borchii TaxID=42251 RepID=A0A2T6ZP98_TUBBO|nr:hypothetical protein B9Z19DRAFT_1086546 [Tuber borchii]